MDGELIVCVVTSYSNMDSLAKFKLDYVDGQKCGGGQFVCEHFSVFIIKSVP